jgi:multidrug efflux pump subunit AcrB
MFAPIIMTALAMVAGMLPLALGLEAGSATALRSPSWSSAGLLSSLY